MKDKGFSLMELVIVMVILALSITLVTPYLSRFSKAIELEPNNAAHYKNRGNIRLRAGDRAGANADLTRAAQLTRP